MQELVKDFEHVDYLWNKDIAADLGDDQVALFLYRSNILGADLRITNSPGCNIAGTVSLCPLPGTKPPPANP